MRNRVFEVVGPAILAILVLTWPLAWRYTSLGIDLESPAGDTVDCVFYRLRWPGDGSVMVGWIEQSRRADRKVFEAFDLGGVFLRPGRQVPAGRWWNRLGFRYIDYDRVRDGDRSDFAPGSQRAKLIGVPHGLFVLGFAAIVVWRTTQKRHPV